MSSFSEWCDQDKEALSKARREAEGPQKYPRLADYDLPEASPAADPASPAPADKAPPAAIEAPERWDSLW